MDYKDMEKMKHGDVYDEYVDKATYYISYKSGKPREVTFRKKNIISAFQPDKKAFVEEYLGNHDNDEIDEQYLVSLVSSVNR